MIDTTTVELSNALKDAGAKQKSRKVWYWYDKKCVCGRYHMEPCFVLRDSNVYSDERYYKRIASSFYCHELLEGLPSGIDTPERPYRLTMTKHSILYFVGYYNSIGDVYLHESSFSGESLTEALGKLKLWCLKNDYCEKDVVI